MFICEILLEREREREEIKYVFHQKVHKWRRMNSILLYGGPMESYTTFAVKLELSRPESDLSHLSGIRCEAAHNGRKDLVNCKIVPRSLGIALTRVYAQSMHLHPSARRRLCVFVIAHATTVYVHTRMYVSAFGKYN